MRVAFLGYGNVGAAIAGAVATAGHDVVLAINPTNPDGATDAARRHPALAGAAIESATAAVLGADVVVLALPFAALEDALADVAATLVGKVVIDATNPVGPGLTHGLGSQQSGAERVASQLPGAHVVKAFNVYGFENLAAPPIGPGGLRPLMPYAGDDTGAKDTVAALLRDLGWEPLDVGPLAAAVDLEHMTLLWVRLVRVLGHPPRLVWAALRDGAAVTPS